MKKDLKKNLRLQCSICQYPFHYDAQIIPQSFIMRIRRLARERPKLKIACWVFVPFGLMCLVLATLLAFFRIPGEHVTLVYVVIGVVMVTMFVWALFLNELPIKVVRISLNEPTKEQLRAFRESPEVHTQLMRIRGRMGATMRTAARKSRTDRELTPAKRLVISFDYPITLQIMADMELPLELRILLERTNEAARLAQEERDANQEERYADGRRITHASTTIGELFFRDPSRAA
jgi:hypothetical protein